MPRLQWMHLTLADQHVRRPTPSGPRSHRLGVGRIRELLGAITERLRTCGLLRALVRALRLQALGAAADAAAVARRARAARAGRERRRRRPRRRPRRRVQGRVAQPPVARSSRSRAPRPASAGSSATSSRWAPAGRAARRALVRRARLALLAAPSKGSATTATASAYPTSAADRLRPGVRRQLPRERDVRRAARERPHRPRRRGPRRAVSSSSTARRPGVTASAVPLYWPCRAERETPISARRCRSATRSPARSSSRSRSSSSSRASSSRSRMRRRRARLLPRGDGVRRRRHRRPARQGAAARGGHGAVGDHELGVAGADGRGRPARDARRPSAWCATGGSCRAR